MILTGAGATMIAITILITDIATTILIMDITITTLTDTIITILTDTITIILIMGITTIIIHLIAMIGKIITITTKTPTEIPLVNIHLPMAEEGMILAVMKIIITNKVLVLMMKELELVVMIIPQETIIIVTIILMIILLDHMIIPLAPINRIRVQEIVVAVEDSKVQGKIFDNSL